MKKEILFACSLILTLMSTTNCNKPVDFATDSWSHLISVMNSGGYQALLNTYHPNDNTFIITNNDITTEQVAKKTRTITLNGLGTFSVRVIGEHMDEIDDNNSACLTFEFTEVIANHDFQHFWEGTTFRWKTSALRRYLENDIVNAFPSEVKNNLQPVKKATLSCESDEVEYTYDKLFPLSITEITTNANILHNDYSSAGAIYPYYFYHKKPADFVRTFTDNGIKYPSNYWLRAPCEDSDDCAYTVNQDGVYDNISRDVDEVMGVSPAFCLGKTPKSIAVHVQNAGYKISDVRLDNDYYKFKVISSTYTNAKGENKLIHVNPTIQDMLLTIDDYTYQPGTFYHDDISEFWVPYKHPHQEIVVTVKPKEIALDFNDLNEIAAYDENNHYIGKYAQKFLNIGDWKVIKTGDADGNRNLQIIDFGHDKFADAGNQNIAAMTFDLTDVIRLGTLWKADKADNSDYVSSDVMNILNDESNDASFICSIKKNHPDLYHSIRTSLHHVFTRNDDTEWKMTTYACKVTATSINEMLEEVIKPDATHDGYLYQYYFENSHSLNRSDDFYFWFRTSNYSSADMVYCGCIENHHVAYDSNLTNKDGEGGRKIGILPSICI